MGDSFQLTNTPPLKQQVAQVVEGPPWSPEFLQFWSAYPKKDCKAYAYLCYQRAILAGHKHGMIVLRAKQFAASEVGQGVLKFCPHASTWLNQRRFLDDPSAWCFSRVSNNGKKTVDWDYKA